MASTPARPSAPPAANVGRPVTAETAVKVSKNDDTMSKVYSFVVGPINSRFSQLALFSPAIFTLGSLFISFITLNYPIFILALASGEALLIQNGLRSVSNYLATTQSIDSSLLIGKDPNCKSKYQGSESTQFKHLLDDGKATPFPNSALYFVSFASAYCIQCMSFFSEECYERGQAYSSRPYLGYISAAMSIILFSVFTLLYSCDTPLGIILSVAVGLLIGFSVCYQNFYIFGKEGVDLLFIPPLVSRSGMDYICVSTN